MREVGPYAEWIPVRNSSDTKRQQNSDKVFWCIVDILRSQDMQGRPGRSCPMEFSVAASKQLVGLKHPGIMRKPPQK